MYKFEHKGQKFIIPEIVFAVYTCRAEEGEIRSGCFVFSMTGVCVLGAFFQGFGVSHRESGGDVGAGFCLVLALNPLWIFPTLALVETRGKHPPRLVNSPTFVFPAGFLWRAHFPVELLDRLGTL